MFTKRMSMVDVENASSLMLEPLCVHEDWIKTRIL
jgi:hypothetical protein